MMHLNLDIPPEALWAALGFMFVTAVTGLVWFIRWQMSVMTKKEHTRICVENQQAVTSMLNTIDVKLDDQKKDTGAWRDKTDTKLDGVVADVGQLKTNVAVLQATQPITQVNVRRD